MLHQALVMAGGWQGYDLVHCLAQAPGAAQIYLGGGGRLLYTPPSESDQAFLKALACLGVAETEDTSFPGSVRNAFHPVCPEQMPITREPNRQLFTASRKHVHIPVSRHTWRLAVCPSALAGENPAVVIGPLKASRFVHLVWAVRSLMSGAVYLHDRIDLAAPFWPEGGLIVLERNRPLDDLVDHVLAEAGLSQRLRRWALAYCAPAATAARLRRQYATICAAR